MERNVPTEKTLDQQQQQAEAERLAAPDERSDPDDTTVQEEQQLKRWKYLKGGHRIPLFSSKIPHFEEPDVPKSPVVDDASVLELGARLVADAKQISREYIYAQQRCDLLRQEKDLLKWHIANNSTVLKVKQGELDGVETRYLAAERRLKAVMVDAERFEREKKALAIEVSRGETVLEDLGKEYEETLAEMQEWLSRRGSYLADTTLERKRAQKERELRYRQWKKLQHACNVDKKWHTRIDAVHDAESTVFDEYEDITRLLAYEFDRAGDVTAPIREILMGTPAGDPFEGFVSPTGRVTKGYQ